VNAPMIGGEPDALKGACPVWEGLQQDCFLRKEYGVLILLHCSRDSLMTHSAMARRHSTNSSLRGRGANLITVKVC
jgi:hypothetical protein